MKSRPRRRLFAYIGVMKIFEPLKKAFIKDYKNVSSSAVRYRYGLLAGVFGILTNVVLFVMKIVFGLIAGSISVVADAVNNLSDAGSSGVTVVGFKLSNRPPDKEHPFGHARYEYITGLVVAFIVLIIGGTLLKSSIERIITPELIDASVWTAAVLVISIFLKTIQGMLYTDFGKAINSPSLGASATDSRNDVISTSLVLISTVGAIFLPEIFSKVDSYLGIAVSLFIIVSGVKLVKETVDPLLGGVPDKELVAKIREKFKNYPEIIGTHDLMVHSYGPGKVFATIHAEVDADTDVMLSHDLIDNIEREFRRDGIFMVIHMDPVVTSDPEIAMLRDRVYEVLQAAYGDKISLHDFRMVKGITHTNVLFDAVVPFDEKITAEDIAALLSEKIDSGGTTYYYVVNIDRSYV